MKISLSDLFITAKQAEIRYYLLGNGSNILFADEAFEEQSLMFLPKQREWDCRFIRMPTAIIFRHRQV